MFALSSIPSYSIPSFGIKAEDLIVHFIEYSIFGFLLARAFIQSQNKVTWKLCLLIALVGILYAASDEFHQKFVQGRYSEFSDFLADSLGVIGGLIVFLRGQSILLKFYSKK
jgi:VanZ family protein